MSLPDRLRLLAFDAALERDRELWAALSAAASAHESSQCSAALYQSASASNSPGVAFLRPLVLGAWRKV